MKYNIEGLKGAYDMFMFQIPDNFVYFWGHQEKGGRITKACFSQWYPCYFVIDGIRYNCAEQYMMAEKARLFKDEETRKKILQATDPMKMKKLGREVQNFDAEKWDAVSGDVVVRGNIAKFSQNEELLDFLLFTDDQILVEASPYDTIWGIGMRKEEAERVTPHMWRGKNKLGFALMEVRDVLKPEKL